MPQILLDTNIIIDYSKGKLEAIELIESLNEPPAISVITVTELIQGIRDKERPFFRAMFDVWVILPIDHKIALQAGEFARTYRKSHNITLADSFIAATADIYQYDLKTRNIKDFPMLKDLKSPY